MSPSNATDLNFNNTMMDGDYTIRDDKSEFTDNFYSKTETDTHDLMGSTITD